MGKNVINTLYTIPDKLPTKVVIGYEEEPVKFNTICSMHDNNGSISPILFRMLYRRTAMRIAGFTGKLIQVREIQDGLAGRLIGECLNSYGDGNEDEDGDNNTTS